MSIFSNEDKISLLKDLVAIKSVNGNEIEVATYLKDVLNKHQIEAEVIEVDEGRANLVAEIGSGSPVIGISGHMDVVSEGDAADWKYDPFVLTEEDDKLYGRGTADMKAGLAALVIAMIEIKEADALPQGTLRLLVTAGEESTQLGSKYLRENGYMDDVEAMIIAEPTGDVINIANKGSMNFKVTSRGKSAHSSMPKVGKNAIEPLMGFVEHVIGTFESVNQETDFSSFDFTPVIENFGGSKDDTEGNKDLADFLKRAVLTNTLFNGGSQINSVPDKAEAYFNARTVTEFDNEQMRDIFNQVLAEYEGTEAELSLEMLLDLPPIITTGKNHLVTLAKEIGEETLGTDLLVGPTTGVTDASNLLIDKGEDFHFVVFGPGKTSSAHQLNEYVSKEAYFNFIDIYIELITKYVDGK